MDWRYQETVGEWDALPVGELIDCQRRHGRAGLPADFVACWSARHRRAAEALEAGLSGGPARLAGLLRAVTAPVHARSTGEPLTFEPYADAELIRWYLAGAGPESAGRYVRAGVRALLRDLEAFESDSLAAPPALRRLRCRADLIPARLDALRAVIDSCDQAGGPCPAPVRHGTLGGFAREEPAVSALVEFSRAPQSRCHDEVLFLRSVHVGELLFWGIRTLAGAAVGSLGAGDFAAAAGQLREAAAFAGVLHAALGVLRTMPPEHFLDFREYTERASAAGSRAYQSMAAWLWGAAPAKLPILKSVLPAGEFAHCTGPGFVPLRDVLARVWRHAAAGPVRAAAADLDRRLLQWRGRHIGFARTYLPKGTEPSGGTAGVPYLARSLHESLLPGAGPAAPPVESEKVTEGVAP